MKTWVEEFKEQSIFRLDENIPRITKCLNELTEEEIWYSPNKQSNSIGHLILHLCGNITQYIHSSLGGAEDNRKRNLEFTTTERLSRTALIEKITKVIEKAKTIVQRCTDVEFLRYRTVQGFNLSGMGIVIHVVEHLSYHTGQITYYTKELKNKDLEFYKGQDLDALND
jgi:uncharacterized damage-inducible protein DinB